MPSSTRRQVRAHRTPVTTATPPGRRPADYADQFEITLDPADPRTAEQFARAALECAHPVIRTFVWVAHTRVLRFGLAAAGTAGHVFGWRIERAEPNVIVLAASGPLASAMLIGRRADQAAMSLTTFGWFERRLGQYVWWVVGPVHRRVAPYLLQRTAATFAESASAAAQPALGIAADLGR